MSDEDTVSMERVGDEKKRCGKKQMYRACSCAFYLLLLMVAIVYFGVLSYYLRKGWILGNQFIADTNSTLHLITNALNITK